MWQAWTNGILGVWLVIAAFLPMGTTANLWDDLIVGVIAAVAGFAMAKTKVWQGWLGGLTGVLLVILAFIPACLTHTGNLWCALITGILLMVAGFGALKQDEN